jgi:uncharacterized cupredoxin-like copper-binding protein
VTPRSSARATLLLALVVAVAAFVGAACDPAAAPPTPPISTGSSGAPREVNIIAKDWQFLPDHVDLVPGETVLFHLVNGGLEVHEFVIGDGAVQEAWEAAEAATVGHPPGPTPLVSVDPARSGLRVVVESGQRVDVTWTVPAEGPAGPPPAIVVGCHIPGHWEKGMVVPITYVPAGAAR